MYKKKILEKLENTKLTKKEKRIAEFFLDEEQRVFLMNVADIAKAIDVSDTSVIRFIKSLGFENFTDFKNSGQENIKSRLDKTNVQRNDSERMDFFFITCMGKYGDTERASYFLF